MKTYNDHLREKIECDPSNKPITKMELNNIERVLDKLFASLNIDIAFTNHFHDRLNDARNGKQISSCEVIEIYRSLYKRFGKEISDEKGDVDKMIKSVSTKINIPIVIKYDKVKKEIDLVAKTTMRTRTFHTKDKQYRVE